MLTSRPSAGYRVTLAALLALMALSGCSSGGGGSDDPVDAGTPTSDTTTTSTPAAPDPVTIDPTEASALTLLQVVWDATIGVGKTYACQPGSPSNADNTVFGDNGPARALIFGKYVPDDASFRVDSCQNNPEQDRTLNAMILAEDQTVLGDPSMLAADLSNDAFDTGHVVIGPNYVLAFQGEEAAAETTLCGVLAELEVQGYTGAAAYGPDGSPIC